MQPIGHSARKRIKPRLKAKAKSCHIISVQITHYDINNNNLRNIELRQAICLCILSCIYGNETMAMTNSALYEKNKRKVIKVTNVCIDQLARHAI